MNPNQEQLDFINAKEDKIMLMAGAGAGKAQPDYTLIPTPKGLKRLDELKIGDEVYNRIGKKVKVLDIFPQGEKRIYEVYLADGRKTECCEEHLWSYDNSKNGLTTNTLKKMIELGFVRKDKRGHNQYKFRIPNLKKPIEFENSINLSVDPYTLGCFLGDGCCKENKLTISSADIELVETIAKLNNFNYIKHHPNNYSWYFIQNGKDVYTKEFFKDYLSELVCYCGEKRIPKDYLFSSIEQRFELLRGLMDTDGYIGEGKHSPTYNTTSLGLAEDVQFLCRSLGFYTTLHTQVRPEKKSVEYEVLIFTGNENTHKIFKLSRKYNKTLTWINKSQRTNHNFISIVNIVPTDKFTSMRCILVDDKEHLYLTNDFIVTHNTFSIVEKTKKIVDDGVDPSKVLVLTFTNMATEELRKRLVGYPVQIYTIHSYCNYLLCSNGYDTSDFLNDEKFDRLFYAIKKHPEYAKEVDFMLLDEAHDTDINQFSFIFNIVKPKRWCVCADLKQTIYEWRGAYPKNIIKLMRQPDVKIYYLNYNYRCKKNILTFAKRIINREGIDYEDHSIATQSGGQIYEVPYNLNSIADIINKDKKFKDWFVLTRSNDEIALLSGIFDKCNIPHTTFKQGGMTHDKVKEEMSKDQVIILTIHSAKGLEREKVVVVGVGKWTRGEHTRLNYVAATRAKDLLIWMPANGAKKKKTMSWE